MPFENSFGASHTEARGKTASSSFVKLMLFIIQRALQYLATKNSGSDCPREQIAEVRTTITEYYNYLSC